MEALRIQHLQKSYDVPNRESFAALGDVTFEVRKGEFVSIVGPSGCGKTTLLTCIAGLRSRSGGQILLYGKEVTQPPREMALIFQEYGRTLLPWKTVLDNVIFGMENRPEIKRSEHRPRGREVLNDVGLSSFEHVYPWQLSGGQQQRVAIARGLANGPDILLMDEPFASVDAQTRAELEDLLLRVWQKFSRTILFVTHDIDEAIYLSDRVIVLCQNPSVVLDTIAIEIERPREQISSREHPRFLHYRRYIHKLLQRSTDTGTAP
ncbi:MAG: ABC transporter ATP-binding protein [Candidatus Tectomicrobia bacterium]|nr:ABC transporter ATP-binding protein [Candidatus Tectomicrobia bacterium]